MSQQSRQAEYPDTRSQQVSREVQVNSEARPRFHLSVPQIMAGALAAASAAVAASWLGVAGTVLGAVVASVVVSITSALYSHPLERSTQVIREVLPLRPESYRSLGGTTSTQTLLLDPITDPRHATEQQPTEMGDLAGDESELAGSQTSDGPQDPRRGRVSWATVVVSSLLTLVVGFGVLTGFETLIGRSVSSLTGSDGDGGTTFSRVLNNGSSGNGSNNQQPTTPTETTAPDGGSPTTSDPSESPTTDEPTTTEPTPDPTEPTPTEPTETQPPGSSSTGGAADPGVADGAAGGLDSAPSGDTTL